MSDLDPGERTQLLELLGKILAGAARVADRRADAPRGSTGPAYRPTLTSTGPFSTGGSV